MSKAVFPAGAPGVQTLVALALAEDVGAGDLTSNCTIDAGLAARGRVIAREPLVLCGVGCFDLLCAAYKSQFPDLPALTVSMTAGAQDGRHLTAGAVVCTLEGPAREILTLERTFLNFLGHLSGIATETAVFVEAVKATGAATRVLDTRKTTPGLRLLEKYAVVCGGGANHRIGLFDAVLIKDNHVVAAGGVAAAVGRALAGAPAGVTIEVECDSLEQVGQALSAGATAILLDNFTPEAVAEAVSLVGGRARLEVSGGVNLDTVAAYARAGANDVSVGRLTHSARSMDLSMEVSLLA